MNAQRLVGDIGGTNARFAVLDSNKSPVSTQTFRTDEFSSLQGAITTYLSEQKIESLDSAAIAVATPVVDDFVKLTNNHWSFSIDDLRTGREQAWVFLVWFRVKTIGNPCREKAGMFLWEFALRVNLPFTNT